MDMGRSVIYKVLSVVTCFLVTFFALSACSRPKGSLQSTDFLMDTVIQSDISGAGAQEVYEQTIELLSEFDRQYSMYQPESDISRINEAAGMDYVPVNPKTYNLLETAVRLCEQSGGKFDITIGPLVLAWDVTSADPQVPDISPEMLELVNYRDIRFRPEDHSVMLAKAGQKIDLGGLAKGVACDEAKELFRARQPEAALLSIGGNIVGFGQKDFTIGIQDPREENSYFATLPLEGRVIATSGDYQRYFEQGGRRYHHILDPQTGFPVENDLMSVSVLAESGLLSDYHSTLLFTKSIEELKALRSSDAFSFVAVDHHKNVYVSDNLKDKLKLNDTSYTLQTE